MKKEQFKSILLSVLVVLNVFLASQILIDKKLWPSGYNFFSHTENSGIFSIVSKLFKNSESNMISRARMTMPERIIINTGDQTTRISLNSSHGLYNQLNENTYSALADMFSKVKNAVQVEPGEWYAALTGKSVYLSYEADFDAKLYLRFMGTAESEVLSAVQEISDVVLLPLSQKVMIVYMRNRSDDTYYKISSSDCENEIEAVIDLVRQNAEQSGGDTSPVINYSFDLFFDKAFGNQRVILDPMIPIYSTPQSYRPITSENPIIKTDGTVNQYLLDKLLHAFGINSSTVRRYTEASGTLVFVENNATLKISPDGFLDYSAREGTNGMKISDSGAYSEVCAVADFMDGLNAAITAQKELSVSSVDSDGKGTVSVAFDYTVQGLPVNMTKQGQAVYAQASGGCLQKYTQLLRSYSVKNEVMQTPEYITALDLAIAGHMDEDKTVVIKRMSVGYTDDGSIGDKYAEWHIDVKD
jgi:uncharacterized protein (DUF302 family)